MTRDEFLCSGCYLTKSVGAMGTKWKPIIIWALRERTMRFGQLAAVAGKISRKVLTDSLKELEQDGVVLREQFKELPPRVEYSLTKKGQALVPILKMLYEWGKKY